MLSGFVNIGDILIYCGIQAILNTLNLGINLWFVIYLKICDYNLSHGIGRVPNRLEGVNVHH